MYLIKKNKIIIMMMMVLVVLELVAVMTVMKNGLK